jgi:hypothetical protein
MKLFVMHLVGYVISEVFKAVKIRIAPVIQVAVLVLVRLCLENTGLYRQLTGF